MLYNFATRDNVRDARTGNHQIHIDKAFIFEAAMLVPSRKLPLKRSRDFRSFPIKRNDMIFVHQYGGRDVTAGI